MIKKFIILMTLLLSLNSCNQKTDPPNIVMMIGDGMGLSAISSGMYSNNNYTSFEESEYVGLSKTHSYDDLVTDSAASATAMSSGVKTQNKVVGLDSEGNNVQTILEKSIDLGYSTAILVTSSIVHASPASYYAHINDRYNYEEIANQFSKSRVDFFIGGGEKYFNNREDNRDLTNEMSEYTFVSNIDEFEKSNSNKIGFLTSKKEPVEKFNNREPSLDKAIKITLNKLEKLNKPFFLLVEGSQIDWGSHDNDQRHMISEMLEFDNAVGDVFEFAKNNKNTLVVITADHETGGVAIVDGDLEKSNVKNKYVSGSHTASMVPVFSYGPYSVVFKGIYDNTEIFDKLEGIIKK
ncbi:MAG: alkaline phosphatase [Flavobacteriaceae bacterium]|nr:alkaline phosphatase [Flavobacteriaceae bacterium]